MSYPLTRDLLVSSFPLICGIQWTEEYSCLLFHQAHGERAQKAHPNCISDKANVKKRFQGDIGKN